MSYPSSIDNIPNVPANTNLSGPPDHTALHNQIGVAVETLETKLGTGASTPVSGQVLIGNGAGTSEWADLPSTDVPVATFTINGTVKQREFNIIDYGATISSSDNTTAIQAAFNAANTAGGGEVFVPQGIFVTTNLTIHGKTILKGVGESSVLQAKSGTTGTFLALNTPSSDIAVQLQDIKLDGNNQSGLTGIYFNNTGVAQDSLHRFNNVWVYNYPVDGIHLGPAVIETDLISCHVYNSGRYGFNFDVGATDNRITSCSTGLSLNHGFYIQGNNTHFTDCKAYYAGYTGSSWTDGVNGFMVYPSATQDLHMVSFTACEAQNNARDGFHFDATASGASEQHITVAGCMADGNNEVGTTGVGFAVLGVKYSNFTGLVTRLQSGANQNYGLAIFDDLTGTTFGINDFSGGSVGPIYYDGSAVNYTFTAPIASPAFTGTPIAPTQTTGDNTTKIATDAFVNASISATAQYSPADFVVAPSGSPRKADYYTTGTNDDVVVTTAVTAANALANGGVVELASGTYIFGGSVLPLNNVWLRGTGMTSTIIKVSSGLNVPPINFHSDYSRSAPLNNFWLTDLEIDCSAMLSSGSAKGIDGTNYNQCRFQRLYVHDSTATGIGVDFPTSSIISENLVVNCGYKSRVVINAASWSSSVFTFTTTTPHGYTAYTEASGLLTASGTPANSDTVTIGSQVYTFVTSLSGSAYQVLIGASTSAALTNLAAAVNASSGSGTTYGTGTVINSLARSGTVTSSTVAFNSTNYGTSGNSCTTTTTSTNLSWGSSTLIGGVTGSAIVVVGTLPNAYNGQYNVSSVIDANNFTVSSNANPGLSNIGVNPGTATAFGWASVSGALGNNGIGIGGNDNYTESLICTNNVCIGNRNNNYLMENDGANPEANTSYIFSNNISISAGACGYRNTACKNVQFNNNYEYGSPTGGYCNTSVNSFAITAATWSTGVATYTTGSTPHGFAIGQQIVIQGMSPTAWNGAYLTVASVPTTTTFTVAITSNPGTATTFGTVGTVVRPVDGTSFIDNVFINNVNYGINLSVYSDGVLVKNNVVKYGWGYGIVFASSLAQITGNRIFNNGRQGMLLSGSSVPMTYVDISDNFIYNNGLYNTADGIDFTPSTIGNFAHITLNNNQIFDNQPTQTQRYGMILRNGGTLTDVSISGGDLSTNQTAPMLIQSTSTSLTINNVIGVSNVGVPLATPRVTTLISVSATFTPNASTTDLGLINSPGAAFTVANPTGTAADAQILQIRITSGSSGHTPTWGTAYSNNLGFVLPTSNLPNSSVITFTFEYNAATTLWLLAYTDYAELSLVDLASTQTIGGVKTFSSTISGSISGIAANVTTNANLTGPITSTGNATAIASQTGTGTTIVTQASPTLTTPSIAQLNDANGNPWLKVNSTASAIGGFAITNNVSGSAVTLANGNTGNSATIFKGAGSGLMVLRPGADSILAYALQNAAGGTYILSMDSSNARIGIGTSTINSTLQVAGSISTAIAAKSSAYTIVITDSTILVSGTTTITLPTAVGITGRMYTVKKTDTAGTTVTVATTSSQNIDGATTSLLATQYQSVTVQSDGTQWWII